MGLYHNRIQAPTKTLTADWIPEEGEIFRDSSGNFYCGDNVTASDALTPINGASPRLVVRISQSSTDAPTQTELRNDLGIGSITWSYVAPGIYGAALTRFLRDGHLISFYINTDQAYSIYAYYTTDELFYVNVRDIAFSNADDLIVDCIMVIEAI